jgi:hypothetical protein
MGGRVLIDELTKTTFRYYLFASFTAKTSLTSGQKAKITFPWNTLLEYLSTRTNKSDDLNLFLVQRSAFKN